MILKKWRESRHLPKPKDRPNDFQRLVLGAVKNGMQVRDAVRVFGVTQPTINRWQATYGDAAASNDLHYFVKRASALGASDELIAQWFGINRVDKVTMIVAEGENDA